MTELYPALKESLRSLGVSNGKLETDLDSDVCEKLLYENSIGERPGAKDLTGELDYPPSFLGYPESPFSRRLATNLECWMLHK